MYVPEKVTGVTVVGVRGHPVAVEAHVGGGLPSGYGRSALAEGRGSSAPAPYSLPAPRQRLLPGQNPQIRRP